MTVNQILDGLRSRANSANLAGMARYGINTSRALGVPVVELRRIAREAGRSHSLATGLWDSGIHEARILATIVDFPAEVTRTQMNRWARDFDSWEFAIRPAPTSSATLLSPGAKRSNGRVRSPNSCGGPPSPSWPASP